MPKTISKAIKNNLLVLFQVFTIVIVQGGIKMNKIMSIVLILAFSVFSFGQADTPVSTAKGLFDAWQKNNKTMATKYAMPKAIEYLFDSANKQADYKFESCAKYNGLMHCWYRNENGSSLNLTMMKVGKSWKVKSMEWVDVS
jgi:hypothetical protein